MTRVTNLSESQWQTLLGGANHMGRIYPKDGRFSSIYGVYRYPARFSPTFVRGALNAVASPQARVLDPFLGSGTTIFESLRGGYYPTGIDLSPISNFIVERFTRGTSAATLKRTEEVGQQILSRGSGGFPQRETLIGLWPEEHSSDFEYQDVRQTLEGFTEAALEASGETAKILQLVALSAGQWAIDGRRAPASKSELLGQLELLVNRVPALLNFWQQSLAEIWGDSSWRNRVSHLKGDSTKELQSLASLPSPLFDVSVTSPPYPGVHMLYAKWQLRGRKESHLPAYIVGADAWPESHLTMGNRVTGVDEYFEKLKIVAESLNAVTVNGGLSIQLVGFSDSSSQLPKYVEIFEKSGLKRIMPKGFDTASLARDVPSRKWQAASRGELDTKKEHLLVFRKPTSRT